MGCLQGGTPNTCAGQHRERLCCQVLFSPNHPPDFGDRAIARERARESESESERGRERETEKERERARARARERERKRERERDSQTYRLTDRQTRQMVWRAKRWPRAILPRRIPRTCRSLVNSETVSRTCRSLVNLENNTSPPPEYGLGSK